MKHTSQFRYAILAGLVSSAMLFSASSSGAEEVTIPNHSFETPLVGSKWYSESDLSSSEDFIWKNNLGDLGKYGLVGKGTNLYTAAADGDQAVRLCRGVFVSQTLGPTVPDTIYTLTFSILQSKNPDGTVKVEIFDGENLIATEVFKVPDEMNVWQAFSLTANSPHVPSGELAIKFTGETLEGIMLLDNVSLTAAPIAAAPSQTRH